ncbi:uncharacterized protein TNCV_1000921 [Trichonephila clavipes]|nr:uncharacterized protein TNCV_1000921 [Trichonephila clavipes]
MKTNHFSTEAEKSSISDSETVSPGIPLNLRESFLGGYLSTTETMPHRGILAHYEQLSEFERGCIIELKEAGLVNQKIARHMGRSDAAIRRCWQELVENGRFQGYDCSD